MKSALVIALTSALLTGCLATMQPASAPAPAPAKQDPAAEEAARQRIRAVNSATRYIEFGNVEHRHLAPLRGTNPPVALTLDEVVYTAGDARFPAPRVARMRIPLHPDAVAARDAGVGRTVTVIAEYAKARSRHEPTTVRVLLPESARSLVSGIADIEIVPTSGEAAVEVISTGPAARPVDAR
jgi:hypothetical protein